MEITITMRLIDDFSFHRALQNLRVFIVYHTSKSLKVLLRLALKLLISEHVADLLQVVRRF
jgi:hypothetical protein